MLISTDLQTRLLNCWQRIRQSIRTLVKKCLLHKMSFNMDFLSNPRPCFNTLRPRQNGRHFLTKFSNSFFANETIQISIEISPKFVRKVRINHIPALVQIMAWRRPDEKPLSEPMMVSLLTHICVTRPK